MKSSVELRREQSTLSSTQRESSPSAPGLLVTTLLLLVSLTVMGLQDCTATTRGSSSPSVELPAQGTSTSSSMAMPPICLSIPTLPCVELDDLPSQRQRPGWQSPVA